MSPLHSIEASYLHPAQEELVLLHVALGQLHWSCVMHVPSDSVFLLASESSTRNKAAECGICHLSCMFLFEPSCAACIPLHSHILINLRSSSQQFFESCCNMPRQLRIWPGVSSGCISNCLRKHIQYQHVNCFPTAFKDHHKG